MNGTHEGVSGYTISTSFPQVDRWSTRPSGFGASHSPSFYSLQLKILNPSKNWYTISQSMGYVQNRGGNLPRPQVTQVNKPGSSHVYDESIDSRPKGRPYPIEKPYRFQGQSTRQILNIAAHDPQL